MSLIQIHLYTEEDVQYKDVYIEVKGNIDFKSIFNKIEEAIKKEKIAVNKTKMIINKNLYYITDINEKFFKYFLDNSIECDDLDDMEFIFFVSVNIPELIYSEQLTRYLEFL
jgi:hypothetical protein